MGANTDGAACISGRRGPPAGHMDGKERRNTEKERGCRRGPVPFHNAQTAAHNAGEARGIAVRASFSLSRPRLAAAAGAIRSRLPLFARVFALPPAPCGRSRRAYAGGKDGTGRQNGEAGTGSRNMETEAKRRVREESGAPRTPILRPAGCGPYGAPASAPS